MYLPFLALALALAPMQDSPAPVPAPLPDQQARYDSAMRCAGVMAAMSSLHAFTGNTEGKRKTDQNGRGFITAATGYAQPLGLTQEQLSAAFTASTANALGAITATRDQAATDAAIDRLNADHDACLALVRGWLAETNGIS